MLEITEVRIHPLPVSQTNLRAYASITISGCFVVHGLRVLQGEHGLFVGMPRRKRESAPTQDIAHPITSETRQQIESAVLDAYEDTIAQTKAQTLDQGNTPKEF